MVTEKLDWSGPFLTKIFSVTLVNLRSLRVNPGFCEVACCEYRCATLNYMVSNSVII